MVNLWTSADPAGEVRDLITRFWAYADTQAREELGLRPDYHHINLESRNLSFDINRNYFSKDIQDSITHFMDHFAAVDQSNGQKHQKSILEDRFRIDITAIEIKSCLPRLSGAGKRKALPIRQVDNIYSGALHNMPDVNDNYCLFRAIVILIQQHLLADSFKFSNYKNNNLGKQREDIKKMMDECEIDRSCSNYSIEQYGDKIQVNLKK